MKSISRHLTFVLILAMILASTSISALAADSDTTVSPASEAFFQGHRYALFDVGLTWSEAKAFCEEQGGHLVTVSSAQEQSIIDQLLNTGTRNSYWLGGYKDTRWKWITGESFSYTHWCPGQPDNYTGTENKLHAYRNLNPLNKRSALGYWNDLNADGTCKNEAFFGTANFGLICEWDSIGTVSKGQYLIYVVDEDGMPLKGASITYDGETKLSNAAGYACFDAFSFGTPVIEVKLDDYLPWTNQDSNWEKSESRFETVILYPESAGSLKLSSARYSNSPNMSLSTNLLTTTKKVSLGTPADLTGSLDFGKFYVSCKVKDSSMVKAYQLWQGSKKISENTDGFFSLNTSSFSKGGNCFILVIGNNGDCVKTSINLSFELVKINEETSLDLSGKTISFKIGDDVPYLGGYTFNSGLPFRIPLTAYVSENKVRIGFNVNRIGDDEEKQLKDVKKLCSDLKRLNGLNVGKLTGPQSKKYKSLIGKTHKWSFFKKEDFELNILGYAEGDLGSAKATGAIILQFEIDALSYEYNTWCVVVPVTVQFEIGLEGSATFEVSYDFNTETLDLNLRAEPCATLTAFGGIGVSKLVGVGAYGSASLLFDIGFIPNLGMNKIDLTGELGVKAYLGLMSYQKPYGYNTWHLYTSNTVRSATLSDDLGLSDSASLSLDELDQSLNGQLNGSLYDASQYVKADLSYLEQERDLMGVEGADTGTSIRSVDLRTAFSSLIQNTYRNAQPVMVSSGDALYAAFLRADASSERVYTVVSKYDGTEWKTAVAASTDDTLDSAPALLADNGGNIWLAYAKTGSGYSGSSLLNYAQNQEIVVGKINPDTLAFTQSRVYSNMGYSHMQQLSLVNGQPTLVWLSSVTSSDNDVLWPQENAIYKAVCNGTTWSSAQLIRSIENVVTEIAVGEDNGELMVACVMDDDNRSNTSDDKSLYLITETDARQIATGGCGVCFDSIPGGEGASFIWVENGVLRDANGTQVQLDSINGQYNVSGNCIYYSINTENGAELCVARYENGEWGLPITLTEGEGYLENLCIGNLNGNDYVLGLYTTIDITDETIEDRKDLVWTAVTAVSDLRITDMDLDSENLVVGEDAAVSLEIVNAGDHAVSSIDVYLDDDFMFTEEISLNPGQSGEIIVPVACTDALETHTISILEMNRADYYPDDNRITFKIGYPDLAVSLQCNQISALTTVYAIITNGGISSASGTLSFVDAQGNVLSKQSIVNVAAGSTVLVSQDFDWNSTADNSIDIKAILECTGEDLYDYNNVDTIHLVYSGYRKLGSFDLTLPSKLTTIEDEAFLGAKIKSVKIPSGLTHIGARAFMNCVYLEQIEIPASVVSIADDAFEGIDGFVIYCPEDSFAGEYAEQHNITCIYE